jgi:hypothetical protein
MVQTHIRPTRRSGRWLKGGAICLLFATASSWAVDEQASSVGLRGLLPATSPAGLGSENFELLDGNWTEWGNSTNALVEQLYSDEALDITGQRALLAQLKSKVGVMETALKDIAYTQLHGPLADLHGRLARRVELASALLDILETDPTAAQQASLDSSYSELKSAISSVRSDLSSIQGGDLWVPYLQLDALTAVANSPDSSPSTVELLAKVTGKLSPDPDWTEAQREFLSRPSLASLSTAVSATSQAITAPRNADPRAQVRELSGQLLTSLDEYEATGSTTAAAQARVAYQALKNFAPDRGARLADLMRSHYFNYNLRAVVSEGLMQRVMGDSRNESAWINQCVMGARINGSQWTNTSISVDLRPSMDRALIAMTVDGTVQANTTGTTDQATVFATGYHRFHAEKGVFFDGHSFTSTQALVGVNAHTNIYSAQSNMSGIPLLGRIADGIALGVAQDKAGEANNYTANQIRNEVGPRLDNEAQSKFDKANLELETRVWGPLREQGMYPDTMHWCSTDSEIQIRTRLMDVGELGGANPAPNIAMPAGGVLLQTHESLISNFAERFEFAGKTMKESEVRQTLRDRLKKLLGKDVEIAEPVVPEGEKPQDNTLVFAATDPIRFQIEGGQVKYIMRVGMIPQNGDEIPTQIITVPMTFRVEGDKIIMVRGNVGVKPIEKVDNPMLQITRARIMIQNIQRTIPQTKEMDANLDREVRGKKVHLSIVGIDARDGWLSIQAK